MVFAKHLRDIGDEFRQENLDSMDPEDKTKLEDWTKMEVPGSLGGPSFSCYNRTLERTFNLCQSEKNKHKQYTQNKKF